MCCIFRQLGSYFPLFLGVWDYCKTVLKGVEVNRHKLLLPPSVTLNKNNISLSQESLVASY